MPNINSILQFLQPLASNFDNRYIDGTRNAVQRHLVPGITNPDIAYGGVPRPKFLFGVRFFSTHFNRQQSTIDNSLAFMVKYVDKPKISFTTEALNQYNKTRFVHTKLEYQPVTLRFHDTVDDRVLNFFDRYFQFYFGDGRKDNINSWNNDIVRPEFYDDGEGWGFSPDPNSRGGFENFFTHMEILQFYGGYYNLLRLVRPKIEMFDHDSSDYEAGTTGSEITMSMRFEGVMHETGGMPITPEIADEFELGSYSNLLDIPGTLFPGMDLGTFGDIVGVNKIFSDITNAASNSLPTINNYTPNFNGTLPVPPTQYASSRGSSTSVFGSMDFGSSSVVGQGITNISDSLASSVTGVAVEYAAGRALSSIPISQTGAGSTAFNYARSTVSKYSTPLVSDAIAGTLTTVASATGTPIENLITTTDDGMSLPSTAIGTLNDAKPPSAQQGVLAPPPPQDSMQTAVDAETVVT